MEKLYFKVDGISWDTNGQEVKLPISLIVCAKNKESIAETISDEYGFCVNSIEIAEPVDAETYNRLYAVDRFKEVYYDGESFEIQHNLLDGDIDESVLDMNEDFFFNERHVQYVEFNKHDNEECIEISFDGGFIVYI
jgi:hypothetical protein